MKLLSGQELKEGFYSGACIYAKLKIPRQHVSELPEKTFYVNFYPI